MLCGYIGIGVDENEKIHHLGTFAGEKNLTT
jgi:hypothetical protein